MFAGLYFFYLINNLEEVCDRGGLLAHGAQHGAEGQTEEDDSQGVGPIPTKCPL